MCKTKFYSKNIFILLAAVGLLFLCSGPATGQTTEEPSPPQTEVLEADPLALETPDEEAPGATNPPPYIGELLEKTEMTQDRLTQMRAAGWGWGNIKIAASLAEQMAVNSGGQMSFDVALDAIMAARAEGKGLGQIAKENNLKIGQTVRQRNQKRQSDVEGKGDLTGREFAQTRGKKRGFFARLAGLLGIGKKEKLSKSPKPDEPDGANKPERLEKPKKNGKSERSVRPDRGSKPEKPEKIEKPSKPERSERPSKPETPEKPQRGPKR